MKITVGYYNSDGKYLGKKQPNTRNIFYLVTGTVRKKIGEAEGQSPYTDKDVMEYSMRFCDRTRLILDILKFANKKFRERISYGNRWSYDNKTRDALIRIHTDLDESKKYYYRRTLGIPRLSDVYIK